MSQLSDFLRDATAAAQSYLDRIGLQIEIAALAYGVAGSLIAAGIVWLLTRIVDTYTLLSAEEKKRVKAYFELQTKELSEVFERDFDPEKDFVDNSKELISHRMPREYSRHVRGWWFLPRRKLRLAQMVRIAGQTIRHGQVCALVGEPASGKTVEMVKIFLELARRWKPRRPLPVLVFVNALSRDRLDSILDEARPRLQEIAVQYLQESPGFKSNRVSPEFVTLLEDKWAKLHPVLLFDAVDEISDKKRYEDMVNLLKEGGGQLQKTGSVVLSCREGDFSGRGSFVVFRILPLTRRQILAHYRKRGIAYRRAAERALEGSRIEHIAHYLTNVYFLRLYLDWRGSQDAGDVRPPSNIGVLFERMFLRELNKQRLRRQETERAVEATAGAYLQEALAPIALVLTEAALPAPPGAHGAARDPEPSGILLSAPRLLRAISEQPREVTLLRGWRSKLWAYTMAEDPAEREACLSALSSAVAGDQPFVEFLLDIHPHPQWSAREIAARLTDWAARWGCVLPREREGLESGLAEIVEVVGSPARRAYAIFQLALSLRAVGWATEAGILRVDRTTGHLSRFRHQRIREYLAAHQIVASGEEEFLARPQVDNSWWRQTLNMLAAVSPAPDWMLDRILGPMAQERNAGPEPWRVLVAAQSLQFLPEASRELCRGQIERVTGALLELALARRAAEEMTEPMKVDQVLAVAEVGPLVACGLIPSSPDLVLKVARLARATGTRSHGVGALMALLRASPGSRWALCVGLSSVAYTLMWADPNEPARPFGRREPRAVRSCLWLLDRSGWLVRGLPPLLWAVGVISFLLLAFLDPLRRLRSPQFLFTGLLLAWLLWDSIDRAGNWANSFFRLLGLPTALALRVGRPIRRFVRVAPRWVHRLGAALWRGVGRAVRWTARATVWSAASTAAGLRTLGRVLASGLRRMPPVALGLVRAGVSAVRRRPDTAMVQSVPEVEEKPLVGRSPGPPAPVRLEVREVSLREQLRELAEDLAGAFRRGGARARTSARAAAGWLGRHRRGVALTGALVFALYGMYLTLPYLTSLYQQGRSVWRARVLRGKLHEGREMAESVDSRSRQLARRLDEMEASLLRHAQPAEMLKLISAPPYADLQEELAQLQTDLWTARTLAVEGGWDEEALPKSGDHAAFTSAHQRAEESFHQVEPRVRAVTSLRRTLTEYLSLRKKLSRITRVSARAAAELFHLSRRRKVPAEVGQRAAELENELHPLAAEVASFDPGYRQVPAAVEARVASWRADLESRLRAAEGAVARLVSLIASRRAPVPGPVPPLPKPAPGLPVAAVEFERREFAPLATAVSSFAVEAGWLAQQTTVNDPGGAWAFLVHREVLARRRDELETEASQLLGRWAILRERLGSLPVTRPDWRRKLSQKSGSVRRQLADGQQDLAQAAENLRAPASGLQALAEEGGRRTLAEMRTAVEDAAGGPRRLRDLAGRFAVVAESAGRLERQSRELVPKSLPSWWRTGAPLRERLAALSAETEELGRQATEVESVSAQKLTIVADRAREFSRQCRDLAAGLTRQDYLRAGTEEPSPGPPADLATQSLHLVERILELQRALAEQRARLADYRQQAENRIQEASPRVQVAARSARLLVFLYLALVALAVGVGCYLGNSLWKQSRLRKLRWGIEDKSLAEKRDYLLQATVREKQKSVREVAMSSLADLALSTRQDLTAILETSGRLATGRGADRDCSERLVGIAADVKMRIQRGVRSPDGAGAAD